MPIGRPPAIQAALILVTAWAFRLQQEWIPKASVALNGFATLAFSIAIINFAIPDRFGLARAPSKIFADGRAQTRPDHRESRRV